MKNLFLVAITLFSSFVYGGEKLMVNCTLPKGQDIGATVNGYLILKKNDNPNSTWTHYITEGRLLVKVYASEGVLLKEKNMDIMDGARSREDGRIQIVGTNHEGLFFLDQNNKDSSIGNINGTWFFSNCID